MYYFSNRLAAFINLDKSEKWKIDLSIQRIKITFDRGICFRLSDEWVAINLQVTSSVGTKPSSGTPEASTRDKNIKAGIPVKLTSVSGGPIPVLDMNLK